MRVDRPRRPRWLVVLATLVGGWALLAVLLVLQLIPDTPRTVRGWVLLLVIGPPLYAALEWIAERTIKPEWGRRISRARFSVARVAVALVLALLILVPLALAWWYLRSRFVG